jgi:Leucine-rich repeat
VVGAGLACHGQLAASAHDCRNAGQNHLSRLERISYLRQFQHLELVNLADNPICREANYKSYILSHLKNLKYLDYNRVQADDVAQAIEHHQDEVMDLREKDEKDEEEQKALAQAAQHVVLMKEANLDGVDSLFDDVTKDDVDWHKLAQVSCRPNLATNMLPKLCRTQPMYCAVITGTGCVLQIPGLLDGWNEVRDKWTMEKDNFKTLILDMHATKKSEFAQWNTTLQQACTDADQAAQNRLLQFETDKKHMIRQVRAEPQLAARQVAAVKVCADCRRPRHGCAACASVHVNIFQINASPTADPIREFVLHHHVRCARLHCTC